MDEKQRSVVGLLIGADFLLVENLAVGCRLVVIVGSVSRATFLGRNFNFFLKKNEGLFLAK